MLHKELNKTKIARIIMRNLYYSLIIIIFISCSEESPISGVYQAKDKHLSAAIIDSTLYLMIGADTAIIYNLHIHTELQTENNTYRIYNVVYFNSLNRSGYRSIEIPLKFEYAQDFGGTLIISFVNNDSFIFGGYSFQKARNEEGKKIFDNWSNLIMNNTETKLWYDQQDY